jgi:hypothetical protein
VDAVSYAAAAHQPAKQPVAGQSKQQQHRKNSPLIIGKRPSSDSSLPAISGRIVAAKPYLSKAVFCIDNVSTSVTDNDLKQFVASMNVTVLTCHAVKPRRSRWQRLAGITPTDRKAFCLCIPREESSILLNANIWPAHISISRWIFSQKTHHRPGVLVEEPVLIPTPPGGLPSEAISSVAVGDDLAGFGGPHCLTSGGLSSAEVQPGNVSSEDDMDATIIAHGDDLP